MPRKSALTPNQVRQRFRQRGETITSWAAERGYDREAVYRVINGKDKANYGRAHEIAVALGMKVPEAESTCPKEGSNTHTRAVA